jgi:hypothetical protein
MNSMIAVNRRRQLSGQIDKTASENTSDELKLLAAHNNQIHAKRVRDPWFAADG